MALTRRTVDKQLTIYVDDDGNFISATAIREDQALDDGTVFAERAKEIDLTLTQVKNRVAALT